MNISLYIIGTELMRGIIIDQHTGFLTKELNELGFNVNRSVIVPDDGTIEKSISLGITDSDVLLITGGLGPTSDDMTRSVIASLAGVPLEKNKEAWDTLYARVGERIYGANEQQTMIPHGFEIIPNPNGTAPGFKGSIDYEGHKVLVVSMPGPPREMQPMFLNFVKPELSKMIGYKELVCDEYSVFLIAEAKLEELCLETAKKLGLSGKVTWGTRFQPFRISLYVNGADEIQRNMFISELRDMAGQGLIENGNIEAVDLLVDILKEKKLTISCAESATGGFLAKVLTDKAGSSDWFWGGVASYNAQAKVRILNVDEKEISTNGMVTEECARQMAYGMRNISKTDIAVSITGLAGPSCGNEKEAVGTVCFGFDSSSKQSTAIKLKTTVYSRESARRRFTVIALVLTRLYLLGFDVVDIASHWMYI